MGFIDVNESLVDLDLGIDSSAESVRKTFYFITFYSRQKVTEVQTLMG